MGTGIAPVAGITAVVAGIGALPAAITLIGADARAPHQTRRAAADQTTAAGVVGSGGAGAADVVASSCLGILRHRGRPPDSKGGGGDSDTPQDATATRSACQRASCGIKTLRIHVRLPCSPVNLQRHSRRLVAAYVPPVNPSQPGAVAGRRAVADDPGYWSEEPTGALPMPSPESGQPYWQVPCAPGMPG